MLILFLFFSLPICRNPNFYYRASKNKKMPNTDFDLPSGIGLANDHFRAVFREIFSPKTALFSFSSKK